MRRRPQVREWGWWAGLNFCHFPALLSSLALLPVFQPIHLTNHFTHCCSLLVILCLLSLPQEKVGFVTIRIGNLFRSPRVPSAWQSADVPKRFAE